MIIPVAVEKLAHFDFAEIASRQEALQTISPGLLDIFYHPIFDFFWKNRLFQQPPLLLTVGPSKAYFKRQPALATGAPGTQRQLDGTMAGKPSNYDRPRIRLEFQSEFPSAVARFFGWQRRPFH